MTTPRRNAGWSLVELAVVMATIAVLGVVLWRVLPSTITTVAKAR